MLRLVWIPSFGRPYVFEIVRDRGEARLYASRNGGYGRWVRPFWYSRAVVIDGESQTLVNRMLKSEGFCDDFQEQHTPSEDATFFAMEVECGGTLKTSWGYSSMPAYWALSTYFAWLSGLDPYLNVEELVPYPKKDVRLLAGDWPWEQAHYDAFSARWCPAGVTLKRADSSLWEARWER